MELLINAKKLIYILLIFSACGGLQSSLPGADCNLYAQWVTQNSGTTQHLYDVYFINTQTGWAGGNNGTMLKTTNGGNNWVAQTSGVTFPIYSVHFVNANIGYAVTRIDGYFIKTTNGGTNWFTVFFSPMSFESIYFIDSLRGWASGTYGTGWVFRTTNGGINWDSVSISTGTSRHVYYIDVQTGWASVGSGIYRSTNGGLSWVFQYSTIGFGEIAQFSFTNFNLGWILTSSTWRVYNTTNSGNNWTFQAQLIDCFNSHSIHFSNTNTGWVSGDCGQIFKTTNSGVNWYQENTGTNNFLNSVYFVNDSIGWSVGGGGKIIHTSNGGSVLPVVNTSNEIPEEFQLYQNFPNPFNNETVIEFDITKNDNYKFEIFNVLGQRIEMLFNRFINAGKYKVSYNASEINSGIYFYKLSSSENSLTKKFILIK